jgi:hypothetical protein
MAEISANNYGLPSQLTEQAIFDKVAAHLIQQGRAAHDGERCVYREASGRACAVGCLIQADRYSTMMEGHNVYHISGRYMPELVPFEDMLNRLQCIHDSGDEEGFGGTLNERLTIVANHYGLSTAVLDANKPRAAPQAVELTPPALPAEITRFLAAERETAGEV